MKYIQLPLLSIVVLLSANTAFGAASTSSIDTPVTPPTSSVVGSSLVPAPSHAPPSSSASSAPSVAEIKADLNANFRPAFEMVYGTKMFTRTPLGTPVTDIDKSIVRTDEEPGTGRRHITVKSPKFGMTVAREISRTEVSINVASDYGSAIAFMDMIRNAFLAQCKKNPKETALGIGEGTAYLANQVLSKHIGTYIFNEMNPIQLMGAACDLPPRDNIFLNDKTFGTDLEFAPNSIGLVSCSHVYHYLGGATILRGSQQIFGWLKPGGLVFISGLGMRASPFDWCRDHLEQQVTEGKKEWPTEINPKALATELKVEAKDQFPFDLSRIHPLDPRVLQPVFGKIGFKVILASNFPIMELSIFEDEKFKANWAAQTFWKEEKFHIHMTAQAQKAKDLGLDTKGLAESGMVETALRQTIKDHMQPGGLYARDLENFKKSGVGFILQKPMAPTSETPATPPS